MDNYEIARDRAQVHFLGFDQKQLISTWRLKHDDRFFYVDFLGRPYGICRITGRITRFFDGQQAGFSEVRSIFDFLCHEAEGKYLSGRFAPVNSLKNAPKAGGVETDFHKEYAQRFDADPEGFRKACIALGGVPVDMGDMGFEVPLFGEMKLRLKFYHSDDEFPAAITFLWDENTLQYLFYETVFYIAGFFLQTVEAQMDDQQM